jgi:N-acetylglucosaminyldiphosphoundecaprenol N-acetyl-beta-D-mannosaminyltransferase
MYIDDSVRATQMVANGESTKSVNVGRAEVVSINDLASIVEDIAESDRMNSPALVRLPLIPVDVAAVTPEWVVEYITSRTGGQVLVGNLNLHGLYLYLTDDSFRDYCQECDFLLIDGMPVWLLARLRDRRISRRCRMGSTDWLDPYLKQAPSGTRVMAVGGALRTAAGARDAVRAMRPDIDWRAFDGFTFRPVDRHGEAIAETESVDLALVGLGMPLQERWIVAQRPVLSARVIANVGACLDYLAGTQARAPRWLGRIGLEWLFRLLREPRRLWHRYLVEPILLALAIAKFHRGRRG